MTTNKFPSLQSLAELRKRQFLPRRMLPPPIREDLTDEQAGCVAIIVAAASNLSFAAARLKDLGVPLPEKKARVIGALVARADELEQNVMGHYDTDGAETGLKLGDAYLVISALLPYLNGEEIQQAIDFITNLAKPNDGNQP